MKTPDVTTNEDVVDAVDAVDAVQRAEQRLLGRMETVRQVFLHLWGRPNKMQDVKIGSLLDRLVEFGNELALSIEDAAVREQLLLRLRSIFDDAGHAIRSESSEETAVLTAAMEHRTPSGGSMIDQRLAELRGAYDRHQLDRELEARFPAGGSAG